jgi:hypothetical protein
MLGIGDASKKALAHPSIHSLNFSRVLSVIARA